MAETQVNITPERKIKKQHSDLPNSYSTNPFDSDSEDEGSLSSIKHPERQLSTPATSRESSRTTLNNLHSECDTRQVSPASSFLNSVSLAAKNVYKKKFDFSGLQRKLSSNPFDSDSESDTKSNSTPSARLSIPKGNKENFVVSPVGHNDIRVSARASPCTNSIASAEKAKTKKKYHDLGDLENQNLQEMENYAVYKAKDTTETLKNCLKIAEEISESGAQTLATLEQQGEQITQTHLETAKVEHDLSMGEKLLGSLGGLLSKPWIPKKTRTITGPLMMRYNFPKRSQQTDERERFGFVQNHNRQSNIQTCSSNTSSPFSKIEVEKAKQDDALSDLSNLLGQIKNMAIDMGSEVGRQNEALDHLHDDVDELNYRVQGANLRGRRLLRK